MALAGWSLRGITRMTALDLPRVGEIRLDWTVLAFAVTVSIVTGLLFGLVPSLGASRPDLAAMLRASGEAANRISARRGAFQLNTRSLVVTGQVALSMVLLIGAALLMRSMARLHSVNPGFQPANLLTMQIAHGRWPITIAVGKIVFIELAGNWRNTIGAVFATVPRHTVRKPLGAFGMITGMLRAVTG